MRLDGPLGGNAETRCALEPRNVQRNSAFLLASDPVLLQLYQFLVKPGEIPQRSNPSGGFSRLACYI
jgi:hypothetical protein